MINCNLKAQYSLNYVESADQVLLDINRDRDARLSKVL